MTKYDPKTGEWLDEHSGQVLKLNCGDDMDDIALLIAKVAFNPWLAQTVYAELCKIARSAR